MLFADLLSLHLVTFLMFFILIGCKLYWTKLFIWSAISIVKYFYPLLAIRILTKFRIGLSVLCC